MNAGSCSLSRVWANAPEAMSEYESYREKAEKEAPGSPLVPSFEYTSSTTPKSLYNS